MFNNAKLIINYNDSKTKVSINNVINVKTVEWNTSNKKTQNIRPVDNISFFTKEKLCQLLYTDKILVKIKSLVNTHLLPLINKLIY